MSPSRIGWIAVAAAGGTVALLVVTLLGSVDTGTARTSELQDRLRATPPASAGQLEQLGRKVDQLDLAPRIVVTTAPGPAGAAGPPGSAGAPGRDGRARAIVITTPGPVVTRTVRPQPATSARRTPTPTPSPTPTATAVPCPLGVLVPGLCPP